MENSLSQIKTCPNCSTPIADNIKICPECGIELYPDTPNSCDTEKTAATQRTKIYQKSWFVALILFVFFPIGLFMMWKQKKFNKITRIIISIVLSIPFIFFSFIIIALLIQCNHDWQEATCTAPKTCIYCGETEGELLDHSWLEPTCTAPETCATCGTTRGEKTDHIAGEWITTEHATLVDAGVEEILCTQCGESLDRHKTAKKIPQVTGASFNFSDGEFIDWMNEKTNAYVSYTDLDLDSLASDYTSYKISYDGETGAFLLRHDEEGNICAILTYFEDYKTAGAMGIWIGSKIDDNFSTDTAAEILALGELYPYTAANITVLRIELDEDFEVTVLAPEEYINYLLE